MDNLEIMIQVYDLTQDDWDAVRSIYIQGMATRNATFETTPPSWEQWDVSHLPQCRIIVKDDAKIIGWAALSPVSNRSVYNGVAEVGIYMATSNQRQGVGKILLTALIELSESEGIWTLESTMFPENEASIRLHRSCGFRKVGYRERIGRLDDIWRDTILMERRNKFIGNTNLDSDDQMK